MKKHNRWILTALALIMVVNMCLTGCQKAPEAQTTPTETAAVEQTKPVEVTEPTTEPTIEPTEAEVPEEPGVQVGDVFRISQLASTMDENEDISFYHTSNGKSLTAFEDFDEAEQMWHAKDVQVYPCTDYGHNYGKIVTSSSRYVVVAYKVPATGAIQLHTRTELLGDNGYTVKIAKGTPDNIVGKHEVTGWKGLDYRYGYGLKVTEGETLYMIYEPDEWKKGDSLAFANYIVYTGMGPKAEPIAPVNKALLNAENSKPLLIRFTDIVGRKNGMNGLTFYYTSNGKDLTPLANYDAKEGKWYYGTDGVLVYPCLVKKDNYGLFGSSASEYIVMGYKLPATGTIDLFTWAALQGDGVDYQVKIAKNSPTNFIESFKVKGPAETVGYRNTVLDVKRGDVLYIHYKPLKPVNGAWGGYNTMITYTSGGEDYRVFDPNGIETDGTGETIPFTTLVEPGKNGANGLTFYYTSDGKKLDTFTDYDAKEGKWYHGGTGTLVYPVMEAEANYGLVGSSSTEYVALGYEITKKGTIDLYTWFALQSGHDYQMRIAKGTPENILYTYDVKGESQTVVEKTTRMNVNKGDTIYVLYKPLEQEDGAWGGNKVALTWVSVGTHTGPADPETIVPDDLKPGVHVGDRVYFAQEATDTNGENGLTFYHTSDGKNLTAYTEYDAETNNGRWYNVENNVTQTFVDPTAIKEDNYGHIGTSATEYVAMSYKFPETGTVKLYSWMALQSGEDYQIRIAKGTPDKILYTYDVKGESQTILERDTVLNVEKDDMLYILYKPLEAVDGAWAGYKNMLTWVSVGKQTGPEDPDPINPDIEDPEKPEDKVNVGDTFKSAELAPAYTNGTGIMTYYYTTDGTTLTPFSTYDSNNHNGRWYYYTNNAVMAFADPFVNRGDNYGWIGNSSTAYVTVGYKMPASGTISLSNWLALHTGHDCKVTVAQGTLDNVVAVYDVTGAVDTILDKTDTLTVTKGEEVYVIYQPVEKTATADSCYYGYKTQFTYTAVEETDGEDPEPTPSVKVGDVVKFGEAATTTNGENGLTFGYTADGKSVTAYTAYDPNNNNGRWYNVANEAVQTFVDPFANKADNYGLIGTADDAYVAMEYIVPETGTVDLYTWLALQSGHDYQIRIAKGTPDHILYTYDVAGESQTVVAKNTVLNVNKNDKLYILYKPLEAADGAWAGYINSLTWVSVGEQTGPADPDKIVPDDMKPDDTTPDIEDIDDGVTKILTIGNSFTVDTMEYVHKIAKSAGVTNLQLGKIVIGGSSVDDHYNNAMSDATSYEYGKSTENGGWLTTYGNTMKDVLLAENWDYVMVQQHSPNAGNPNSFTNLNGLLDYISSNTHEDTKIVWNMTWAYQNGCTQEAFATYDNDQMTMYNAIVNTAQSVLVPNEKIDRIIPNATSIQNARTSYVGDTLTMDGYHLSRGQGRYIAAMTFAKVMLGVDPAAVTYTPAGVSDAFRQMTVEAVNNAVSKPFEVTASSFTTDKVDTSAEVNRPTQEFASLATTTNGRNGLTFYYTTDGKDLVAYTNYDATQGRWYDNSNNQLNFFDPAEVVANNYGLGQCSSSKYVAMGYKAAETGSLDLFALTVIQGPEADYSYNVRIALGDPENTVHQYTVSGKPGLSQEERYTLDVTKGQEVYIIYENLTDGGWFGYKNSVTWRTAATEEPDEPEVVVGDTFKSAELAPANTNGTGIMTYYYTADGANLTPFSTYDPTNHGGRWYRYTNDMLAFVDPFVDTSANYGWIGNSASEYVVVGYKMPASGTISMSNWLALHTGHDCKVMVAQGTLDNIVATYDVTGAVDTILDKTETLTVTKGEEIYVIYQPIESTASANSCYYGYKTQFTYTEVADSGSEEPEPTPSVKVGDVVKFGEAATTTNGENGLTFGYTADGKTVTAYTTYDPNNNNGRWYNVANEAVQTFVDPFANKADNYGLIGTADDAYVAMEYVVPETGTVDMYTWLALQSGHDYQIRIAKGTPDHILYTYDVTGESQTVVAKNTVLNVNKNDKLYILYKPLEAADGAWAGYINSLTWVSVGEQTGPEDPDPIDPEDPIPEGTGQQLTVAQNMEAANEIINKLAEDAGLAALSVDVNLKPVGALSNATTSSAFADGKAVFTYKSGDTTVEYIVDTTRDSVKNGLIEILTRRNGGEEIISVTGAGLGYTTSDGEQITPKQYASAASVVMQADFDKTNGHLYLDYQETYEGVMNAKMYDIFLMGKSLAVHVTSPSQNGNSGYAYFTTGSAKGLKNPRIDNSIYCEEVSITVVEDEYFLSAYLDKAKTFATLVENDPSASGTGTVHGMTAYYEKNSAGKTNPVNELFYVTVSDDFLDCAYLTNGQKSEHRDDLNDLVIYDSWDNNQSYTQRKEYLNGLHEKYDFKDVLLVDHRWQRDTLDISNPAHYPASTYWGTAEEFSDYITTVKNTLGWDLALHEDYWFMQPSDTNQYWNVENVKDKLAQNADGSLRYGWQETSYANLSNMMTEYAKVESPKIEHAYNPSASFLDVNGGVDPSKMNQVTLNAESTTSRTLAQVVADNALLFQTVREIYGGPVISEGAQGERSFGSAYAGFLDAGSREITDCNTCRIMPDYELLYIRAKMANQGMGPPARFQPGANVDTYDFDKLNATTLAYGHAGFIGDAHYSTELVEDELVKAYYMFRAIQPQYLDSNVTVQEISYFTASGSKLDLDAAILAGYNFKESRLYIRYSNGLEMYLNFAPSNWDVTINGHSYTLDQNGYAAENPNKNFVQYSCLRDGVRVDFVSSSLYTYANPRGNLVDFGNGLITSEPVINGVGQKIPFTALVGEQNGANGLTFYHTTNGKTLDAYSLYDASQGRWYDNSNNQLNFVDPAENVADNYGLLSTSASAYTAMGYKVPKTGTVKLTTWLALQSGHDYQIRIAKGTPDNILYTYDVTGESQTVVEKETVLNVTKDDELYILYKPLEAADGAWAGYINSLTWVSVGNQTGPADPDKIVPDDLKDGIKVGDVVKFGEAATTTNGENGLTFGYTADGKTVTAYTAYDPNNNNGRWYNVANEAVQTFVDPFANKADNYGLIGTADDAYVAMEYIVPETGTVDLYTWFALQSGHDYQIRIAKGTPDHILYTYDVTGESQTVVAKNTVLNVNKNDKLYILYKPLEAADGAWAGYINSLTWVSVGTQTGPADPDKIVPDDLKPAPSYSVAVGDVVKFGEAATTTNGENGLTFGYTADGKTVTAYTGYDPNNNHGRWYNVANEAVQTFVDPFANKADNYGLIGTADDAYVAMEYVVPETGTVDLYTWLALQSGHDYQIRIAKGTPDHILYTYDVAGESQTVVAKNTVLNVNKNDKLYILYKPLEAADGAWAGYINSLTWVAVGEQTGPADPDKIVPDDLKPAPEPEPEPEPEPSVKVGDTFTATALMPTASNGEKGMYIYHTADGTTLSDFSGYDPANHNGRWWYSTDAGMMAFIDPFVIASDNYGWVGTSDSAYVVMGYKMPEAGTIELTNWLALHSGIGCKLQIAVGTPGNVVKTYDVANVEAVQEAYSLNVAKNEIVYVIFQPMEGTPTADTCYFGYKTWYTYTAVG